MDYFEPDPDDLEIDKTNERRTNIGAKTAGGDLEKSVAENGVIFPVYVREVDGQLKVVAGQRRTNAAQAVGEDSIPAIKMDLDDPEARAISMMENDEELRKSVPRKDRARSTRAYVEQVGGKKVAAENLGVSVQTIENRLETTRSFWKDTEFGADTRSEKDTEQLPDDVLRRIRSITNDGEEAEKVGTQIIDDKVPRKVLDTALTKAESRKQFERELDRLYYGDGEDVEQVNFDLEFEGELAKALATLARDKGTDPENTARQILENELEEMAKQQSRGESSAGLDQFT